MWTFWATDMKLGFAELNPTYVTGDVVGAR
jgi:hypothetical protein